MTNIFKMCDIAVTNFSATLYLSNHSNLRKLEFLIIVSPLSNSLGIHPVAYLARSCSRSEKDAWISQAPTPHLQKPESCVLLT